MKATKQICATLFAFFLISINTFSQKRIIDSLQNALIYHKEDSNKVFTLHKISLLYTRTGNFIDADIYAKKEFVLSKQIFFPKGVALSYNAISFIHLHKPDYSTALKYALKALKIAEDNNLKFLMASIYGNIGGILYRQEDCNAALVYYAKAKKVYEELGRETEIANQLINTGNIYMHIIPKDSKKALDDYLEALKIHEKLNYAKGKAIALMGIGNVYTYTENHTKALEYFLQSLEILEELDDMELVMTLNNIGSTYIQLKKYDGAEKYLKMGLENAQKKKNTYKLEFILENLSELYSKQNKYELSLDYYKKSIALKDSLFNIAKSEQLAEMQTKYETEKKDKELLLLANEKQILQAEKKLNENKKYFYITTSILFLIIIVALGLLIILLISRQKKRREANLLKQQLIQAELEKSKFKTEKLEATILSNEEKLNNYTNQIKEKTELLEKIQLQNNSDEANIQELFKTVKEFIDPTKYWEEFITTFNLVHRDFFDKLTQEYPDLSRTELRLCALMKCNLGNKEIANVLNISPNTIKSTSNRLGKKMNLKEEQNLRQFILKRN